MVHGESSCFRYESENGRFRPVAERVAVMKGQLTCNEASTFPSGIELTIRCHEASRDDTMRMVMEVSARDARGLRWVVLDDHVGFWDFYRIWVYEHDGGIDVTIDYGVLD